MTVSLVSTWEATIDSYHVLLGRGLQAGRKSTALALGEGGYPRRPPRASTPACPHPEADPLQQFSVLPWRTLPRICHRAGSPTGSRGRGHSPQGLTLQPSPRGVALSPESLKCPPMGRGRWPG